MVYIFGDIHTEILKLETNSIDLIYTNPPFGVTECLWDTKLNWDILWPQIWRVLKPNGTALIHASKPFSYHLIRSQIPKYNYNWVKNTTTNFFHAKKQPLRQIEEIYVYYKKSHTYNPQMIGNKWHPKDTAGKSTYYGSRGETPKNSNGEGHYGNYPTDKLEFKPNLRGGKTIPDEMIEFFIKTYSNEGDTVLDMTTHNKVVGTIVEKLNRKFIGIDKIKI
jgi:site-specific DNA-methyltransferase (adenine-specific)